MTGNPLPWWQKTLKCEQHVIHQHSSLLSSCFGPHRKLMRGSCEANSQRTLGDGKPDWLLFYALALFKVGWVDAGKAALR
jgi:hypothetical protein